MAAMIDINEIILKNVGESENVTSTNIGIGIIRTSSIGIRSMLASGSIDTSDPPKTETSVSLFGVNNPVGNYDFQFDSQVQNHIHMLQNHIHTVWDNFPKLDIGTVNLWSVAFGKLNDIPEY